MTKQKKKDLITKINSLKKKKNAVLLVHNYQLPEIYEVADFIGDSLELSIKAVETNADIIVFCGVDFMAESAKILNPEKKVLLPSLDAQCPMAGMVNQTELISLKAMHPHAAIVSYINTYAETKAISSCCCTSANVITIVNALEQNEIIMVPDQNLALYAQRFTTKKIIPWNGYCYVHHHKFDPQTLQNVMTLHPQAIVVVHPECPPAIIDLAHEVRSTSGMLSFVDKNPAPEYIIGTEIGLIERLRLEFPDKIFYSANGSSATCVQMKKNTLDTVLRALDQELHQVTLPENIIQAAKLSLERMISLSHP